MLGLSVQTILSRIVILVTSLSVHEFAHAWTADYFGDDTPRLSGRLTLNPAAHLDLMGSLMLLFVGFGWARPVQVNPYILQRRSTSALMWVSLAGPLSNFALAFLASLPLSLGLVPIELNPGGLFPTAYGFLREFVAINLLLMIFNLIPLAPLDGDKIAAYFFPPALARAWETIRPYGPIILLAIFFSGRLFGLNIIGWVIQPVLITLLRLFRVPL